MQQSGTIKSLRRDRGFGFIRDAAGLDVFFHITDVQYGPRFNDLVEGQGVMFDVEETDRGPRARRVGSVAA